VLAVVAVGSAVVVAAVAFVVVGDDGANERGDEPSADEPDESDNAAEQRSDERQDGLQQLTQAAALTLEEAETFAFDGEIELHSTVDEESDQVADTYTIDVTGEVHLPGDTGQRLDGAAGFLGLGAQERIVSGGDAWRRASAFPDTIDEIPWIPEEPAVDAQVPSGSAVPNLLQQIPDAFVANLIPEWLGHATDHRDGGTDEGNRVIAAHVAQVSVIGSGGTVKPELAGAGATVELMVDYRGVPRRVVLSATFDGTELSATYDLTAIGDPVTIETPAPNELDPFPAVNEHDISTAAGDGVVPMGLTQLPDGWRLVGAEVLGVPATVNRGCPPSVAIGYAGPNAGWLQMRATGRAPGCPLPTVDGQPFTAGEHEGTRFEFSEDQQSTVIDVGFGPVRVSGLDAIHFEVDGTLVTAIAFDVSDLAEVLASLGPVDPVEQAEPLVQ
jgi:hypothetical protein